MSMYVSPERVELLAKYPLYQRALIVAGEITTLYWMKERKVNPNYQYPGCILVGGMSVALYSDADYSTYDLDFVAVDDGLFQEVMDELGFTKSTRTSQRYWMHEGLDVYVEVPSRDRSRITLEDIKFITLPNMPAPVIVQDIHDIVLDRVQGLASGVKEYLYQLDLMWDNQQKEINWHTVKNRVETTKELELVELLKQRYQQGDRTLDYERQSLSSLAVDLEDGSVMEAGGRKESYLVYLSNAELWRPKDKQPVMIRADYQGKPIQFIASYEDYYINNQGMRIENIYSFDSQRIDADTIKKVLQQGMKENNRG